jgi:hypothetical protein
MWLVRSRSSMVLYCHQHLHQIAQQNTILQVVHLKGQYVPLESGVGLLSSRMHQILINKQDSHNH